MQEAASPHEGVAEPYSPPRPRLPASSDILWAVFLGGAIPLLAQSARLLPSGVVERDLVYALLAIPCAAAAVRFGAAGAAGAGLASLAAALSTRPSDPVLVSTYLAALALSLVAATHSLHRRHLVLAEANRRLARLANRDALTGLLNSRAFWTNLRRVLLAHRRTGEPVTLLLLDLDNFKEFNDRYGHLAGDAMLAAVGRAVQRCVRSSDLACRYGGDELAIIAPGTDEEDARQIAERVQACLSDIRIPNHFGKEPDPVTVSIGIACVPRCAVTADDLVAAADKALYAAKAQGRNAVAVAPPR